jgi:hypothetical protein
MVFTTRTSPRNAARPTSTSARYAW